MFTVITRKDASINSYAQKNFQSQKGVVLKRTVSAPYFFYTSLFTLNILPMGSEKCDIIAASTANLNPRLHIDYGLQDLWLTLD
jgi:hypothetical protein